MIKNICKKEWKRENKLRYKNEFFITELGVLGAYRDIKSERPYIINKITSMLTRSFFYNIFNTFLRK